MASVPQSSLMRQLAALRAQFDEAVSGLWVIGPLLAPAWRVVRIDAERLAADDPPQARAGRRPVVARLAPGLGLRIPLKLPRAAGAHLASAAQLALEGSSPIAPGYSLAAFDLANPIVEGDTVTVIADIADRDAVASAVARVKRIAGRVDAVDVEQPDAAQASPRVDLRTGGAAIRAGLSPSLLVASLCGLALLVGTGGLGAAAWRNQANAMQPAASGSPAVRAAQELLAKRRANLPMLDTIEALSGALPSSAYLETLEIAGTSVKIGGRATDAARLPAALRENPSLSGAAFSGPTRGLADGQQTFEITLTRSAGSPAP